MSLGISSRLPHVRQVGETLLNRRRIKMERDYSNYAVVIAIILIALLLPGCAGSKKIFQNDDIKLSIMEFNKISTMSYIAKVEYSYLKDERKDWETVKVDCQTWCLTVYDRISFNKDGKVITMGQFHVNNEFPIKGDTMGAILFGYFCVEKR
jgi:uncharacterized membrane protein